MQKKLSDDKGFPNALSVAMSYTNNGSISQMYTVAEVYADSFKMKKMQFLIFNKVLQL
ncbi:MAG: hypothetical protein L6V95_09580 [Candidatus Melainabacteria bacterium]|nr:MAG: hypothetical protein L6V95_09580 [Candidatus Melainabacteria bacterium]